MGNPICSIKTLPQNQWAAAAAAATRINPANAPDLRALNQLIPNAVIAPDHLAVLTAKYWGSGGVRLTVGFMDNPPTDLRARILSHMNAWGAYCNVQFSETNTDPQVRIARTAGDGYWSYLGTDVLQIPAGHPTMNLDSFTMGTADSEFFRVVRHETGHTLGFPHEHMRSEIVDRIDREKAIAYFMASQGWSREQVIAQVLTPLDNSALIQDAHADPNSIMCYWLPAEIMKDNTAVNGGTDIDSQDAAFAARVYPKPAGWQGFELSPAGSAVGGIASVSRIPHSMEVWFIAPNGSVQDRYWYDGGNWAGFELAPAGSAAAGGIAAVSRIPSSMEVWWVGQNGSVQGAYWYDGGNWGRYELAPAGSAAAGSIAAVSRIPNSMEVWWVGPNGSVQGAYWYEGNSWGRYELAPAGSAAGGIAAVSRIPNSMEVWWVAPNGSVRDAFWYDGGSWQGFELAPAGSASAGGIAAVSRIPNSMELWWVAPNGSIQDRFWYDGGNWSGFELAGPGSATGGIAAVSRIPGSMEVWWTAPNGSIQDRYWYDGSGWGGFEMAAPGSASAGGISAVSRIPGSMEVWWVAPNGAVRDAYWYG